MKKADIIIGMICLFLGGYIIGITQRKNIFSERHVISWGSDFLSKQPVYQWGGQPSNVTGYHMILWQTPDGRKFESGFRDDGVVVWREIKETPR